MKQKPLAEMKYAALIPLFIGLTACGGGSDSPDTKQPEKPPQQEVRNPAWKHIENPYFEFKDSKLKGRVKTYLGRLNVNVQPWLTEGLLKSYKGDMSHDLNGDGAVNHFDSTIAGFKDDQTLPRFDVDTKAMAAYLATNPDGLGAGTARPDVFVEGHYSPFDLLRYIVGTRDDMRFDEITDYKDSKYGTYEFRLSWDINGDGVFNEEDGEYYNSDRWHFAFLNSRGNNRQPDGFDALGHKFNYKRMDNFWLREEQEIRFLVHTEAMTNRRHWVWQQEVRRLEENDGKFVIPMILKRGHMKLQRSEVGSAPIEAVAQNVEVKAYNLRSDVFQPGVITAMDVWLTLAEEHGMDFRFTWWPVMSSGAIVNNFAISYTPWDGAWGGWVSGFPFQGEMAATGDFQMRFRFPECNFKLSGEPTAKGEGEIDQDTCNKEWLANVGGNMIPEVAGANHLSYPPEFMLLVTFDYSSVPKVPEIDLHYDPQVDVYVAENELQHSTLNRAGDFGLYPTADVDGMATLRIIEAADESNRFGTAPILDASHFGWKVADCTLCHNEQKQPLGHGGGAWPTNHADGFDYIQPYYCASCHGANGAPEGHNRGARCFWCHNTHNGDGLLPPKHGDAGLSKTLAQEDIAANQRTVASTPINAENEIEDYKNIKLGSHNSDYTLSKRFPDPFACGTCHGFEHQPQGAD